MIPLPHLQVSICLPILRWARPRGILFYCHYPASRCPKVLGPHRVRGLPADHEVLGRSRRRALRALVKVLKMLYRAPLDLLEARGSGVFKERQEVTTGAWARAYGRPPLGGLADQIFVNSCFTAGVFAQAFPLLPEDLDLASSNVERKDPLWGGT